jgi:thiamine pyrophosphokinase
MLIIANGEQPSAALLWSLAAEATFVVAADGGADRALRCGITPDAVVGDLDSLSTEARAELDPDALFPVHDVDTTDLQKAIAFCVARGAELITVTGAGGGRADHALANLSVLFGDHGGARVRMVDERFTIEAVRGSTTVEGEPGTVVSLVAIGRCEGVRTRGLRWDLDGVVLPFSAYGVHNEIRDSPATVSVAHGDLLLFRGRWVEQHDD